MIDLHGSQPGGKSKAERPKGRTKVSLEEKEPGGKHEKTARVKKKESPNNLG